MQEPQNNFWLYFRCSGDGEELATVGLPTPHYYKRTNAENYAIAYKLDGRFNTKKGKEYLNDIIARLSLTLPIERRYYITPTEGEAVNNRAYKLKEFQNCESIKVDIYTRKEAKANKYEDRVFWSLKYEAERRIRAFGSLDLDAFLDYAFNVFEVGTDVKDGSTLRAKCKSIFQWYESRNWKVGRVRKLRKKGDITMEMTEQRKKANAIKKAKTKAKFLGAIEVLKIKSIKLTARAISAESGISINTCGKYFNEYKEAQNTKVMWIKHEPYKYNYKNAGEAEHFQNFNTEEERDQFLKDYYLIKKFKEDDNLTDTEIERLNFIKEHFPERII